MSRILSGRLILIGAVLLCGLSSPRFLRAASFAEVEPNDTKATANVISIPMVAGDTITGFSTGGFNGIPGDLSPDYFVVQTAMLPPGIYQHRLVLTIAGPPPATDTYAASIVGLQQIGGVIQPNTEATVHSAPNNGYPNHPRRTVQWYGFGRGERFYLRISGNSNTTSTYTLTLVTTQVQPQIVDIPLEPGLITISNASTDPFTFFDAWVYDANRNAMPDFGPNFDTSLVRDFPAGVYYVALAKFDLGNNKPSPDGPAANPVDHQNSPVLDFPDAAVVRATAFNYNISVNINGQFVPADVTGAPYNIVWLKLTVGGTGCTCAGDMDGNAVFDGRDMQSFVNNILAGEGACTDVNNDTLVNTDDIVPFVNILLSGGPCA